MSAASSRKPQRLFEAEKSLAGQARLFMLDLFARTYFTTARINRRLLPPGKIMLAMAAASFLMIWDPSRTSMRELFAFCASAILLAPAFNWLRQPRSLDFERRLPEKALEDEEFDYQVVVTNRGRRSSPPLNCKDYARMRFPTLRDWMRNEPPFLGKLNAFDRLLGYPKWIWLVDKLQDAQGADFAIPALAPGESKTFNLRGKAGRRGRRIFVGFYCGLSDPFGLFQRQFYAKAHQLLLVLPKPLRSSLRAPSGSRSALSGDSRDLLRTGESEEFRSLREWRSGDPLRKIDWKATARLGEPISKEFAPEYKLRTALAFDTYLPEEIDQDVFEDAMAYAAGFIHDLDRKERNIDLLVVGDQIVSLRLGAGRQDDAIAYERLADSVPTTRLGLQELEASLAAASSSFSSAILVCSCWTAEHSSMAERLAAKGMGLGILVCSEHVDGAFPPGAQTCIVREAKG